MGRAKQKKQNIKSNRQGTGKPLQQQAPTAQQVHTLIALYNQQQYADAEVLALEITEGFPEYGFGWKVLGVLYKLHGRSEQSLVPMQRAAYLLPDEADVHNNLGVTFKDLGRLNEAEACLRLALKIKPDYAEAYNNLGNVLKNLGRTNEASACFRSALEIKPNNAEAHNNLGNILISLGQYKEAETCYRNALKFKPEFADAHYNLANTLKDTGRFKEAEACYLRALEINPKLANAYNNLGNTLRDLGCLADAESCIRRALKIRPDFTEAHSNLLLTMMYSEHRNYSHFLDEAKRYGQMVSRKANNRFSNWQCLPQPDRLKVGLVSGDFRNHPVGYFLENILSLINPMKIELIAYPTNTKQDELTSRIKHFFSGWKPLTGLNDETASRLIHDDGVHVLMDLSGHTDNNKLPMFAMKPAPVQLTWLGYLGTTGVTEMDYLLGDPQATPQENDVQFSETVWRLPDIWSCFTQPEVTPDINPLPALSTGCITFGCFNNLTKMNDRVVALWSRVLQAVPGSRLFLKTKQLDDQAVREETLKRFGVNGIEPERLLLEGFSPRAELLAAYNRVDIALDPYPYTGGTTNFEVLWMAVPIITRRGDSFISRGGQSIVFNAGLTDWIAEDDDDYVLKAIKHTEDLDRLAALRTQLRQQVLASPLFDAPRFAINLETALWGMWQNYLNRHSNTI